MSLDLVHGRGNLGRLQQILGRLDREIANSDTPDLARLDELLQNGPGVGDRDVGYLETLGDRVGRGEGLVGVGESDGPVDL